MRGVRDRNAGFALGRKSVIMINTKEITYEGAGDKLLIEYLLKYGDFDDLVSAFSLYDQTYIRFIWEATLKGDKRFIKLNLMLARLFFGMNVESDYFKEVKNARLEKLRMLAS